MLDKASVPRRALDFEDYLSIVRRNFRWLLGPLFAGLVISTVVAYLWPDTYVSVALIRMVPQQISTEVVPDITAQDISDRINAMAQSIESHNTLSTIITSYGLYPKEQKSEPMEDVISEMKKGIRIKTVEGVTNVSGKSLPAMQISFAYRNPILAQKVCADIVSRFIDASTRETLDAQQQASSFINQQYDQAKKDLEANEQKMAEFKARYAGRLPDEMQSNMAQMMTLEQRGGTVADAQARNATEHMMLESELNSAKDRLNEIEKNTPQTQAQNQRVTQLDREIDNLHTSIASMEKVYTDAYPDLQRSRERLKVLQQQRDEAFKEKPKDDDGASKAVYAVSRDRREAQIVVNDLQTRLKANEMEAKRLQTKSAGVNAAIAGYQSRLESLPAGQKEYAELQRDRELLKQRYDQLEIQRQRSAAQIELNRRKQGETLEELDSASLPSSPSQPKRYLIIPIGAVAGLIIGLFIVGMREMKDTSLKTLKDARLYTQLPVLGSVPLLENDVVVQRRKQMMWVGWAAGTVVGLAIMAGSVVHYYISKA
jgi:polysaccharide chain length determinant protein (PEP-CTERM system associated)